MCFEVYNTPLLLPGCGHTICRACAEALITEANFLRCPECRLVYQLRQGIKSLPKNVALERTIDEHATVTRQNFMCEQHPDDAATLYCKTCEKSICLKCYFTSNTLRKGQSMHAGHQVDTSEDAFTKEHVSRFKQYFGINVSSQVERMFRMEA